MERDYEDLYLDNFPDVRSKNLYMEHQVQIILFKWTLVYDRTVLTRHTKYTAESMRQKCSLITTKLNQRLSIGKSHA